MQYQEPTIIDLGSISQYVYGVPGGKEKSDVPVHIDVHGECSAVASGSGDGLTSELCPGQLR